MFPTASIFYLEDILTPQQLSESKDRLIEDINEQEIPPVYLKAASTFPLKRGDVITIQRNRYRNDGTVMWDGQKIVLLDYELDDYGYIPAEFSVITEFPISYWNQDHIDHNDLVPFYHEKLKSEIINNFVHEPEFSYEEYGEYNSIGSSRIFCNEQSCKIIFLFTTDKSVNGEEQLEMVCELLDENEVLHYNRTKQCYEDHVRFYREYDFVEGECLVYHYRKETEDRDTD
jgi:hypothetical protein